MRLTVIGCSGSFPGPDGPASCYLVEADGFRVVVDLGNGAIGPLQRHCAIGDIDAVLLSHLHPDHCMDVLPLYVARTYDPTTTYDRLPVYGPAGAGAHMSRAYGREETGLDAAFEFIDMVAGPTQIGPFTVTAARTAHPVETWAVRIEAGGRVFAYSADTGPGDQLLDLTAGADLFLCEASYREGDDNPPDLHLTGREAGRLAEQARVERLVITHVPPWHDPEDAADDAQSSYDGLVVVARSGASYEI
jgi:ribonuclease BN (tRNA processing enzyme)